MGEVVATETRDINVSLEDDREENPAVFPYLVSSVKVTRVIKGNLSAGEVVEVKQLLELNETAGQLRRKGARGVLFLESYGNEVPFSLLSPHQGVLFIENGRTRAVPGNKLFKTPRSEADVVSELEGLAR